MVVDVQKAHVDKVMNRRRALTVLIRDNGRLSPGKEFGIELVLKLKIKSVVVLQ